MAGMAFPGAIPEGRTNMGEFRKTADGRLPKKWRRSFRELSAEAGTGKGEFLTNGRLEEFGRV